MKTSWLLALIQWIFGVKPAPAPTPVPPPAPAPAPIPTPPDPIKDAVDKIKNTPPDPDAARIKLYDKAVASLGTDASPNDLAPDEYGCAETVSNIIHRAFADFPEEILSTAQLYKALLKHPKFKGVSDFNFGDVIISPTGYATHPDVIPNGHVGIVAKHSIMSNSSATGKFSENFTLSSWDARYRQRGGYPVLFFRRVEF